MTQTSSDKILIVEDDADVCWAIKRVGAGMGYELIVAENGQQAVGLTESTHLCLALLDAKLSDMEGIEVARKLKAHQPSLPIILISGYFYADDPSVQQWIDDGLISAFIGKPFVLAEMRKTIAAAAARGQAP